jgi:Flp pilus assembly protein TadD
MCKPVLVTLPFVLFLLDYWPLRRFELSTLDSQLSTALRLVGEKIPFFVLAIASSAITILAHQALGMLDPALRPPADMRVENALVSYVRYLGKTFWPSRLAVFYPYPTAWPRWEVVTCGLLLVVLSVLVLSRVRSRRWLLVGWFWFLGVLVPFSGLIQVGPQAMADRFMYVPVIGIMVVLTWGLHKLATRARYQQFGLSVAAGAAVVLCLALTRHQLGYWKDGETLFRHALEVTENNADTRYNLGTALYQQGRFTEAIGLFQEAIRLNPDYTDAYNNLGLTLAEKGQMDAAISQYREAIRLNPDRAQVHNNLGIALVREGQLDEAINQYQEAIRLKPDRAQVHNNLGIALGMKDQTDQAILQLQEALGLDPDLADAHNNLGVAFDKKGQTDEAFLQFQEALRLKPDDASARKNLNAILARKRDSLRPPGSPGSH